MNKSTTVKIDRNTQEKLKRLAEQAGESMLIVLQKAVEEYRRRHFFEELNAAVDFLQRDPKAWQGELKERKLWETTLMDGQESDEYHMMSKLSSAKGSKRKFHV